MVRQAQAWQYLKSVHRSNLGLNSNYPQDKLHY